jgi:glycosyltransferase involved in cell wall biosynthesis
VQPRKNYVRLVKAFASLDRPGLNLVIAGGKGWLDDPLYRKIAELGLDERVFLIGFAADDNLPALYSGAEVFVFPSLYEGFGLPPLEAMACGTPVIASNVSSVPEVVGEAGLLVDPESVEAIRGAIERVLNDQPLRASLREKGMEQAKLFTWEKAAEQLKSTYEMLLE